MCVVGRDLEPGECPCSGWQDCDHHACCEGCPDNPRYWCGECRAQDCYDHKIRDMVELLADLEDKGRPRSELEPIIKHIEDWREKWGKNQD